MGDYIDGGTPGEVTHDPWDGNAPAPTGRVFMSDYGASTEGPITGIEGDDAGIPLRPGNVVDAVDAHVRSLMSVKTDDQHPESGAN